MFTGGNIKLNLKLDLEMYGQIQENHKTLHSTWQELHFYLYLFWCLMALPQNVAQISFIDNGKETMVRGFTSYFLQFNNSVKHRFSLNQPTKKTKIPF